MVCKAREEWEVESSSRSVQQTSSMTDTQALVVAVGMGKGLKGAPGGPSMMVPPSVRPQAPLPPAVAGSAAQIAKAPSAIKTNIKSANQVHPYAR